MPESPIVLVFGPDSDAVAAMADPLEQAGIETTRASEAREAIGALKDRRVGLILVHSRTVRPPALEFLAKARELLPHIPRALFGSEDAGVDLCQAVNLAAPHALFEGAVDASRVQAILDEGARLREAQQAVASQSREIQQLKSRITELESRPAKAPAKASAPPPKTSMGAEALLGGGGGGLGNGGTGGTKPGGTRPSGGGFSLAGASADINSGQAATQAALQEAVLGLAGICEDLPVGGAMEFDLMVDDAPRELIRVMNLMLDEPDLRLPVLPRIGDEVNKLMADSNSTFEQIAEVVGLEPSMSARILEVANSPMYGGKEQIRSVQNAVSRVGMNETRNILQAVAGENLFKTRDKRYAALMAKLWMHSLAVAYSNEILARALFIAESDDFFMMGLLHDIGKLLILHLAQTGIERGFWSKKTVEPEVLEEAFRRFHNALGLRLMEKWEYPKSFHDVVQLHNDDTKVHEYDEPVVVTYYSNLLTRKLGFSLKEHNEALINNHQIAQALNMGDDTRGQIETSLQETLDQLRQSYL